MSKLTMKRILFIGFCIMLPIWYLGLVITKEKKDTKDNNGITLNIGSLKFGNNENDTTLYKIPQIIINGITNSPQIKVEENPPTVIYIDQSEADKEDKQKTDNPVEPLNNLLNPLDSIYKIIKFDKLTQILNSLDSLIYDTINFSIEYSFRSIYYKVNKTKDSIIIDTTIIERCKLFGDNKIAYSNIHFALKTWKEVKNEMGNLQERKQMIYKINNLKRIRSVCISICTYYTLLDYNFQCANIKRILKTFCDNFFEIDNKYPVK